VVGLHKYGDGCAGFFVNMAKIVRFFVNMVMNARIFFQYDKECGEFVNMTMDVRVFVVQIANNVWRICQYDNGCAVFWSKLQRMCGEFVNMALDVRVFWSKLKKNVWGICQYDNGCAGFCQYSNDYRSFSIWHRIFMLIQYRNIFIANV